MQILAHTQEISLFWNPHNTGAISQIACGGKRVVVNVWQSSAIQHPQKCVHRKLCPRLKNFISMDRKHRRQKAVPTYKNQYSNMSYERHQPTTCTSSCGCPLSQQGWAHSVVAFLFCLCYTRSWDNAQPHRYGRWITVNMRNFVLNILSFKTSTIHVGRDTNTGLPIIHAQKSHSWHVCKRSYCIHQCERPDYKCLQLYWCFEPCIVHIAFAGFKYVTSPHGILVKS